LRLATVQEVGALPKRPYITFMRTQSALVLATALMAVGFGCRHQPEQRRVQPLESRADSRADWNKLGERWVDGTRDRDVIPVGARAGAYRRIMLVVEHSALEMHDVVVTFDDGTAFSPPTRHVFAANTRSHVIDLPGTRRNIRSVEFRYGNLPGGGRAQAELWAQ
jgi:hypothetical protein